MICKICLQACHIFRLLVVIRSNHSPLLYLIKLLKRRQTSATHELFRSRHIAKRRSLHATMASNSEILRPYSTAKFALASRVKKGVSEINTVARGKQNDHFEHIIHEVISDSLH